MCLQIVFANSNDLCNNNADSIIVPSFLLLYLLKETFLATGYMYSMTPLEISDCQSSPWYNTDDWSIFCILLLCLEVFLVVITVLIWDTIIIQCMKFK